MEILIEDFVVLEYLEDFRILEHNKMKKKHEGKSGNIPTGQINQAAWNRLSDFIDDLFENKETIDYARMLKLELQFIRKFDKNNLIKKIELKTGKIAGGTYTLAEIGKVFNTTRERIRQIEHNAIGRFNQEKKRNTGGKLCHPRVSRKLKIYTEISNHDTNL